MLNRHIRLVRCKKIRRKIHQRFRQYMFDRDKERA